MVVVYYQSLYQAIRISLMKSEKKHSNYINKVMSGVKFILSVVKRNSSLIVQASFLSSSIVCITVCRLPVFSLVIHLMCDKGDVSWLNLGSRPFLD